MKSKSVSESTASGLSSVAVIAPKLPATKNRRMPTKVAIATGTARSRSRLTISVGVIAVRLYALASRSPPRLLAGRLRLLGDGAASAQHRASVPERTG